MNPASDAAHHLLSVARIDRLYRVVIQGTRRIARNAQGTPVDGGGHQLRSKAWGQVGAITSANIKAHRIQPPCR